MLKKKIQEDLNLALKNKESLKRIVLGSLLSAIKNKEKEKRAAEAKKNPNISEEELKKASELSNEEIIKIIQSEIKKRKEAIELYQKGSREELARKEKDELNILSQYLPEQMPDEEIRKIVTETIKQIGAKDIKDMGKVMGQVMVKIKGRAEGNRISKIVKEELNS